MAHWLQLLEAPAIPFGRRDLWNFSQVLAGLVHLGDLSNAEKDEGVLGWAAGGRSGPPGSLAKF